VVVLVDRTSGARDVCGADAQAVLRGAAGAIAAELYDRIAADQVRVAAIVYGGGRGASILFGFDAYIGQPAGVAGALAAVRVSDGFPTLAHLAFEQLATQLLVSGGAAASGFRHFAAPVLVVSLSAGFTHVPDVDPLRLVRALNAVVLNRPDVTRLAVDIGNNSDRTVLTQFASSPAHVLALGCTRDRDRLD
jgi:hypothetical protein